MVNCRLINRYLILIVIGNLIANYSPNSLSDRYLIILVIIAALLLLIKRFSLSFCLFSLSFTFFIQSCYLDWQISAKDVDQTWLVSGKVNSFVKREVVHEQLKQTFNLSIHSLSLAPDNNPLILPAKGKNLRLTWYHSLEHINQGDEVTLLIKLKPPFGVHNEVGFDYQQWLVSQYVSATGYVKNLKQHSKHVDWRFAHKQKLLQASQDSRYGGVLFALATGQRNELDSEHWKTFIQTGTAHLMALSGFHIGLLFSLFYVVFNLLFKCFYCLIKRRVNYKFWSDFLARVKPQQAAAFVSTLSVWWFVYYLAFALPALRAAIMLSCFVFFYLLAKTVSFRTRCLTAAVAVLLFDPFASLNISFWLSFSAVCLIALGLKLGSHFWLGKTKWQEWFIKLIYLQCFLVVCLMPLQFFFFDQASSVAVVANLMTLPWVSITVIPFALLAWLLNFLPFDLASYCFYIADMGLQLNFYFLLKLQSLAVDYAFVFGQLNLWQTLLAQFVCILLFISLPWLLKLALFILLVVTILPVKSPYLSIHLLDVGQGLAVVIEKAGRAVVYDTGARFSSGFNYTESVLIPFIEKRGLVLDAIVVSHQDNDHAGGLRYLARQYPQATIVITQAYAKQLMQTSERLAANIHVDFCQWGARYGWLGLDWQSVWPKPTQLNLLEKSNNRSCVLSLSYQDKRILLTGDIEAKVEKALVTYDDTRALLKSDIALVPHHGSKTSSSIAFVESVAAEHWLISAGQYNRFKHPHLSVINRLANTKAFVWQTSLQGQVSFVLKRGEFIVIPFAQRRYLKWWQKISNDTELENVLK